MPRVTFITDVCDFGEEHSRKPEALATEHVVVLGKRREPIWQRALRCFRICIKLRRHRALKVLLLCGALQFVGCAREQQPTPEIVTEINTLEQRTVAPDSSLQKRASIRKQAMSVEADWQIRNSSTTKEYFDWVKQESAPDYQVLSQTESILRLHRALPGDSYMVEFTSNSSGSSIDVHFFATAD